jgi:hypothetical protein
MLQKCNRMLKYNIPTNFKFVEHKGKVNYTIRDYWVFGLCP